MYIIYRDQRGNHLLNRYYHKFTTIYRIYINIYYLFIFSYIHKDTIKPVLRGHIWDTEKVAL